MNNEISDVLKGWQKVIQQMSEYEPIESIQSDYERQLDCAAEYCRQFSLEIKKLKERVEELESQLSAVPAQESTNEQLQTENAKLKEESQNYENAVRIVQGWCGEITLANGELRKANAAQAKEITHWKANHADLKERLYVATHRTDLPSDRLPLFDDYKRKIAHQQFLIDSLMIEYCPDEMTVEQLENWKVHQRKVEV